MNETLKSLVKDYLPVFISIVTVSFLIWNNFKSYNQYKSNYANNVAVWPAETKYQENPKVAFFVSNGNKTPIYNVFVIRNKRQQVINRSILSDHLNREDVGYSRIVIPGEHQYTADSIRFKGMEMGKGGVPEEFAILFTDSSGRKWMRNSDGKLDELSFDYFSKMTEFKNLHAPLGDMILRKIQSF